MILYFPVFLESSNDMKLLSFNKIIFLSVLDSFRLHTSNPRDVTMRKPTNTKRKRFTKTEKIEILSKFEAGSILLVYYLRCYENYTSKQTQEKMNISELLIQKIDQSNLWLC